MASNQRREDKGRRPLNIPGMGFDTGLLIRGVDALERLADGVTRIAADVEDIRTMMQDDRGATDRR